MGLKKDAAEKGLEVATDLVKNNATNVLGMLFPYAGLTKKAIEMRMEQIEKSNLPDETKQSMVLNMRKDLKRIKNQKAVAQIALDNAEKGTDFSEKSGVNEEWFERYMDAAKFVSSEDMQLIWGKILAGEFEKPGSTPPNMIRVLSEITPELAEAFSKICSMKVTITPINKKGNTGKIVERIDLKKEIIFVPYKYFYNGLNEGDYSVLLLNELGITYRIFNELESLGVLLFNSLDGFVDNDYDRGVYDICIYNDTYRIENYKYDFPIGCVALTKVGEALQQIIKPIEIDGYFDMIEDFWRNNEIDFAKINDELDKIILFDD